MLKALIVDDEPLAHEVILHHIKAHQDIRVCGQCFNATEALSKLANTTVDLLFLDINMPALSGIDLLKVLANRPQVIIISAYREYAFEGFELDVTDYLVKPVSAERFAIALAKVRVRLMLDDANRLTLSKATNIVLKVDRERRKFLLDEITALEAFGNYVKVWQDEKKSLVSSTLKQLIAELPSSQFTQIHKSFVVNNDKVIAANHDHVTLDCGKTFKVGKSFKNSIPSILDANKK